MTDATRTVIRALLTSATFGLLLVVSSAAQAGTPCAEQIIDDWRDHSGVIAGTYEVACYRQAIAGLPDDLRNYSTAAEDIRRALAARLRGEDDPGPASTDSSTGGSSGSAGGGGDDSGGTREPAGEAPAETEAAPETSGSADPGGQDDASGGVAAPADDAFDRTLGDGSSSLPTPVIALLAVVGALALAGCAWLVRRQLARR